MKTGYLHIDGNEALGRAPARPHHWLLALAFVIIAQWTIWQGVSLGQYAGFFWAISGESLATEPESSYVITSLFALLVPNAAVAALTLYLSRRFDQRGARAIGLEASTVPLALVWGVAGLVAAAPHAIAIVVRGGLGEGWLIGSLTLLVVTIVQAGAEELLFRGVVLGFLCARYGVRNGVLISALLFGFWHLYLGQPPIDAIVMFGSTLVFGLTAAVLTLHYGNIGPALGLHVIWNVAANLSATAGFDLFWSAWAGTLASPWTWDTVINGEIARMLLIPLVIETLIIFAACRDTVRNILGTTATS